MTKRAERVYLSFYESNGADNAPRLARAIRQAIEEARIDTECTFHEFANELSNIADELEDPNLLDGIYGNCYD